MALTTVGANRAGLLAWALVVRLPGQASRAPTAARQAHASEQSVTDADFTDVAMTAEMQILRVDSFDAYWSLVESAAIRIGLTPRELSDDARRSVRAEPHERLSPLSARDGLARPSEALVRGEDRPAILSGLRKSGLGLG